MAATLRTRKYSLHNKARAITGTTEETRLPHGPQRQEFERGWVGGRAGGGAPNYTDF